jgi:hypothetical protein
MQSHRAKAHLYGRFDRDNAMAQCRKAGRVAPGSGADVEDATRLFRDKMKDRALRFGKRDAFVPLEQFRRLFGIVLGTADPNRVHPIPRRDPLRLIIAPCKPLGLLPPRAAKLMVLVGFRRTILANVRQENE